MSDAIQVSRIRIENVFGITELEFDPDGVSVIRGDNDTGKTSVLRAISLLLGGGHDPEALRKGADSGEVRFQLEDGTEVWASLTENGTYYKIEGREDVTARQLLDQLQDEISVNPISIVQARPKDRGQILLEAMPMRVDPEDIESAFECISPSRYEPTLGEIRDKHALRILGDKSSGIIGDLYEQRQELHGAKRDKQGTVSDLQQSVEQHDDPEALKKEREQLTEDVNQLTHQKDEAIEAINDWEKQQIEKIREEAKKKREAQREEFDPEIKELEMKRERILEKIEQAKKAEQTKEIIEKRKAELGELEDRYERLSEAIENLRSLRNDFSDDLPQGVSVGDDGEIYDADGIPFENWNEERQVRFAARIAEMRKGKLGIIPIDGIEKLVGDQRAAFLQWARQSDAQFVLTEAVAGEELSVEHA